MSIRESVFSERLFLNLTRTAFSFTEWFKWLPFMVLELNFTEQLLLILSLISKMINLRNQAVSRMAQLLCKTLALNLSLQMQVWLLVFTLFVADLAFY